MSTEANKAAVRRYFAELVSQGKLDIADDLFAPSFGQNYPGTFPATVPPGPERAKFFWSGWRAAFPDWQVELEDLLAEGERVAARITARGTHLGELRLPGRTLAPPTGQVISAIATVWFTFANGRIADLKETHNIAALLQRLGIRPAGEPDPEANKTVARRIVAEVWSRANLDAAEELFAPDFVRQGQVLGPAGVKALVVRLSAERDLRYTIEDIVAEGDTVITRSTARGTFTGAPIEHPLLGRVTPAAGTALTVTGVNIFRLRQGKVVEMWEYGDVVSFAQQLGVIPTPDQTSASPEENKAVVRRIVEDVWNANNLAAVTELWAPAVALHGQVLTHDDIRQRIRRIRTARPDGRYTIDDLIAEDDKVVLRWHNQGTQVGEIVLPTGVRLAPTGKELNIDGINIFRLANGKVVEIWERVDMLGLLQQLGATIVPPPTG